MASKASSAPWWQTGIIYQIYIRSFYDSDGDGVGDLRGVHEKLDYLHELGVDGIWLSPVTVSANADWGYDVVDYKNVDPSIGTLEDFDALVAACHAKDIKVLVDYVPNHTSVQHPWFIDARTGKDATYRDYYIWADPKPDGDVPSNWRSAFGGSAWELDKQSNQYFLHSWYKEQADLNWRNPAVRAEFETVMRFWLDRGVDGFRIDVFNMLIKDDQLRDNPRSDLSDGFEVKLLGQRPIYNLSRPESHEILKSWRKIADSYKNKRLLLGESTLMYDIRQLASFYGTHDELELAFNLGFIHAPFEAPNLSEIVDETEAAIMSPDWPVWTSSNHDQSRFPSRWARGDERKIRCALIIILSLRGTPVLYYGDEVGLTDTVIAPWRLKDTLGKKLWPVYAGRDRSRTPMPWKHVAGAGFTREDVKPWLPYGELQYHNVETQRADENSTLNFTKALVALRKETPSLQLAEYKALKSDVDVWLWSRGDDVTVAINMSDDYKGIPGVAGTIAICTNRERDGQVLDNGVGLHPWEGVIIRR